MIKRLAWLALMIVCARPAWAVEYNQLLASASGIRFVSMQMGVPVSGSFRRFSAQLSFDPDKPQAARARVEIDMTSVDAGSLAANQAVVGESWFAVKRFPTAHFESSRITALGGNRYQVSGHLTIRNVTREVSAPFTFQDGLFVGRFLIERLDYGVGQGVWADTATVANEVEIRFNFVAMPAR